MVASSLFMRFSLAILLNETTFNSDDLILQVFKGLKACLKWKVHLVIQLVYRHNTQILKNRIKNSNWQVATSWLFTSVAKDLNSG